MGKFKSLYGKNFTKNNYYDEKNNNRVKNFQ